MDHRTKEALRYLGYGRNPGEERTLELIRQSFEELEGLREERIVWRREPVTVREPDQVETGGISGRLAGGEKEGAGGRRTLLKAQVQPGVRGFLHPSSESPSSAPGGAQKDRAYHDRRLYADAVQIGDGSGGDLSGGDSLPPAGV